jgi:acetyl-CoA/propionyl-CoA carboxylase biotin carboxyl carrier protein
MRLRQQAPSDPPGLRFLSENEGLRQAAEDAGITFIGPSVHALNLMGDKIRSKNHVAQSGVPSLRESLNRGSPMNN